MRLRRTLGLCLWAVGWILSGCGSEMVCRGPVSDDCRMRGGGTEAVVAAAAAGATWTVTGCRVNGCVLPYRCDPQSGYCVRIPCGEGRSACPPGTVCDGEDQVCR
jgi:hypothetical protein